MGAAREDARREIYETGSEPEFFVSDISRYEDAGDGMIRLYLSSRRGKMDKVEYSVIVSPEALARMARDCLRIASEFRDLLGFQKAMREH